MNTNNETNVNNTISDNVAGEKKFTLSLTAMSDIGPIAVDKKLDTARNHVINNIKANIARLNGESKTRDKVTIKQVNKSGVQTYVAVLSTGKRICDHAITHPVQTGLSIVDFAELVLEAVENGTYDETIKQLTETKSHKTL